MKYLVMECHYSYAVVLDEQGRFLKVANRGFEAGDFVNEVVEMRDEGSEGLVVAPASELAHAPEGADSLDRPAGKRTAGARGSRRRTWIAGLSAAACLIVAAIGVFSLGSAPFGSVYLSINPEVRIDVNRDEAVLDIEGVNADGSALVSGYDHRGGQLDQVIDELVDLAIDQGYLHEGGAISLSLDAEDAEWVSATSARLETHLGEHLSDKMTVTIKVGEAGWNPGSGAGSDYGESDYASGGDAMTEDSPSVTIPLYEDDDAEDSPYSDSPTRPNSPTSSSEYGESDYSEDEGDESSSDYDQADDSTSPYDEDGSTYSDDALDKDDSPYD